MTERPRTLRVTKPDQELGRARRPETVEILEIATQRTNLDGVECLTRLEAVATEGGAVADLSALRNVPTLSTLSFEYPRGPFDFATICDLERIENLHVQVNNEVHAQALTRLDCSRLTRMRKCMLSSHGIQVAAVGDLGLSALASLETLQMHNLIFEDAALEQVLSGVTQRAWLVSLTVRDQEQGAWVRRRFERAGLRLWIDYPDDPDESGGPELNVVREAGTPGEFVVTLDLAEAFGVETTIEGHELLADVLGRVAPGLLNAAEVDIESSAAWVYSRQRTVLEAITGHVAEQVKASDQP